MSEFVLYSYFRSSASFRVRIAMNLKGLKYDYRAIHLLKGGQLTDDYARLNPSKQVPVLIHNDKAIGQSMAIIDYLDRLQPTPRLFPDDAFKRALTIQACEIVNSGIQPLVNVATTNYLRDTLKLDEPARTKWLIDWLTKGCETLENFLKPHAQEFAMGSSVSAADCFMRPHFFTCERFKVAPEDFPTLARLKKTYASAQAFTDAQPDKQPDYEA